MEQIREKRKTERRNRILTAAIRRFRCDGYEVTRLEDIAEEAGISVGTIYNHYRNKGDLLLAIVTADSRREASKVESFLNSGFDTAQTAIEGVLAALVDSSLDVLTREMWREAIGIVITHPDTRFARTYMENLENYRTSLQRLFGILGDTDLLPTKHVSDLMADAFFGVLNLEFIMFVRDDEYPIEQLKLNILRQCQLFLPISIPRCSME